MTSTVIQFPPLTRPPDWAAAPPPRYDDLQTLHRQVHAATSHLKRVQAVLNIQPGPDRERLRGIYRKFTLMETVLAELCAMRYPADLTAWINTTRTLARQAGAEIDRCFDALDQMKGLPIDAPVHRKHLKTARQASAFALQQTEALDRHITCLLEERVVNELDPDAESQDWESENHKDPDNERPLSATESRIIYLADWKTSMD